MTNSVVLLVALTAIASTARAPTPSSEPSQGAQAGSVTRAQDAKGSQWTGYQKILKRHFGPDFNPSRPCGFLKKYLVHVLVVTLPDPSDPHLADTFDNYLAAIELALARDRYLADQYWLPEAMRRKEQAKAVFAEPPQSLVLTAFGTRVGSLRPVQAKAEPDLLDQPGMMLFRRHDSEHVQDELLFLLLVPETPTGGVRQAALRTAFRQAASLSCGERKPKERQLIRMIGPSFSGAAASLARGIADWAPPGKFKFDILTGSATNADVRTLLGDVASFSATVAPDEVMKDFYQYVVQKFTPHKPIIAILTESNTSYGQGTIDNSEDFRRKHAHCIPSKSDPCILELPFPLHVSQLGAEYEKARAQRAVTAIPEGVSRLLSLNLLAEDEPSDVAPAMSPLTKYNSDLSLVNSLMAIARAHIRVVGIQATDPRDELFLAQKIRRILPDVQLFLMESELLFSHTSIADEMRGALVVSRYPLFNLNQLWSPPRQFSPRVQFPTGSSQGVYNATILQLREFDQERKVNPDAIAKEQKAGDATPVSILPRFNFAEEQDSTPDSSTSWEEDDGPKDDGPMPLEYGEPFTTHSSRPPLWVGMVGHCGIWPIGTLGPTGSLNHEETIESKVAWGKVNDYTKEFKSTDKKIPIIFPLGVLHILATLLLFLVIVWHAAHRLRNSEGPLLSAPHPKICSAPPNVSGSPAALGYAAVQLLGWQSLIAIYLAAAAPIVGSRLAQLALAPKDVAIPMRSWVVLIVGLGSVEACIAFIVMVYGQAPWRISDRGGPTKRSVLELITFWFCGLAGLILVIVSACYFYKIAFLANPATQIFLWVRTENWLSGISPMLPLIFLGAAVYATTWLNLYRLAPVSAVDGTHATECTQPLHKLLPGIESLKKAETEADDVAQGRLLVGGRWLFMLAVPTVATIVLFHIRPNAESDWWTWLARGLLGLLILGIVHGLVLLVQLWRTVRKMLDQLSGHPVISVMESMRSTLAAMVGLHPYAAALSREQVVAHQRARFGALKGLAADNELKRSDSLGYGVSWASKALNDAGWPYAEGVSWSRAAAQLVALEIIRALGRRIAVIRALIGVLTIDALVFLMVTRLYPFQPHSLLSGLSWFLLLAVVVVSVWVLVEMERNAVLSYASGSEPGKVTWDASFITHLALFAGVPLLALVAAYFPEIGGPIFDSVQPLLRAAR